MDEKEREEMMHNNWVAQMNGLGFDESGMMLDFKHTIRLVEEPHWISVKDRLPEEGGKYLVTVTSNVDGKPFVKTAWFLLNLCDNGQFKYECEPNVPGFYNGDGEGDWVERNVSHWMPLPEPPKVGENE